MTYDELRSILVDRSNLSSDHLVDLMELSAQYPYCTVFHIFILKALYLSKDLRFSSELHRRALLVPDLRSLFLLLQQEKEDSSPLSSPEEQESAFALIDSFLSLHPEDARPLLVGENEEDPSYHALPPAQDYLDWLETHEETLDGKPRESSSMNEVISQFLEKGEEAETLMIEEDEAPVSALSKDVDAMHSKELFTETLARIYIKQGRYERALAILKSLDLKYPEKNSYFAEQISYLEKLVVISGGKTE